MAPVYVARRRGELEPHRGAIARCRDHHTGLDLRFNSLDWDTPIATAAITLTGSNLANVIIQGDAVNETTSSGNPGPDTGYVGAGGANRFSAAGLVEGTDYHDCGLHIPTHDLNAACYSTYTIIAIPDVQST